MGLDAERACSQQDVDDPPRWSVVRQRRHLQHECTRRTVSGDEVEWNIGGHATIDQSAAIDLHRLVHGRERAARKDAFDCVPLSERNGLTSDEIGGNQDETSWGVLDALIAEMLDRKSTRLNSSHIPLSRMPSSA